MKRATYEDVLSAPDTKVAEILDGELFLSPRPAPPYLVASSHLGRLLGPFGDHDGHPGGWWILDEPELHFRDDVLVPDLGGWRRERLPTMPETAFFSIAPDWVCEVLSPSTERIDRSRKLRIYAQAGVSHAWLVNPVERGRPCLSHADADPVANAAVAIWRPLLRRPPDAARHRAGVQFAMVEELRDVLAADPRIAYALLFGSHARRTAHTESDFDIAVGLFPGAALMPLDLGDLVSKLEAAVSGRRVDLVVLDDAPPALAFRAFRDGTVLFERDHARLVERKARAILEYLDWKPFEEVFTRGVLQAASRRGR